MAESTNLSARWKNATYLLASVRSVLCLLKIGGVNSHSGSGLHSFTRSSSGVSARRGNRTSKARFHSVCSLFALKPLPAAPASLHMAARMSRVYKFDSTARTPSPQRSPHAPAKDFFPHRSIEGLTKARSMKLRKNAVYKAEERRESSHLLRPLKAVETGLCPLKNTAIIRAWRQSPKQKCTICLLSVSPKKRPQTPTPFFLPPPFNGIFSPAERIRLAQLTPKPD